jgi:hypothetical protein
MFNAPEEGNFSMDESGTKNIPQVPDEENNLLTAPYSEHEVRKTIFQMEHNKAPFQLSSINLSVKYLRWTYWSCLVLSILDSLSCSV